MLGEVQRSLFSKYSIEKALQEKGNKNATFSSETSKKENVPNNHFTQIDLDKVWSDYITQIKSSDLVLYSAVHGFQMTKIDEDTIQVNFPSYSAKEKFLKVQDDFFNKLKHHTNHFYLNVTYKMDVTLKQEIVTKKTIFEKYLEINPLLKDLDDLVKFDFS